MGLLRKMRVLVGALVRRPFMPRPEQIELPQKPAGAGQGDTGTEPSGLAAEGQQVLDEGRVADLIAEQQRREAD
jgi:hypothetical protein